MVADRSMSTYADEQIDVPAHSISTNVLMTQDLRVRYLYDHQQHKL
jgi:hypothetical protein